MQDTFIKFFHQRTCDRVVSADKMMVHARGPVWHRKHQEQGIIPKGLTGLDTEATWSYSKSDGWIYGHGTFCLVACQSRILGAFKWMRNTGHEDFSVEIGRGSTPRNGAGSMATVTAARSRPARICAISPPNEWPMIAGFLSNSLIISSK